MGNGDELKGGEMKKVIKRNQVIVTVLAIMIAVAGYLNYTDKIDSQLKEANAETTYSDAEIYYDMDDLLTSSDDIESLDGGDEEDIEDSDAAADVAETGETTADDAESGNSENDDTASDDTASDDSDEDTPGTAVLTSVSTDNTFILESKINREQVRAKNKESLLEIINNENISDDLKSEAVATMVTLTERSEMENTIETLLEAKGFTDVVVTLSDESVDVILDMTDVSDDQRAQIEDVVIRKTGMTADSIVITPLT